MDPRSPRTILLTIDVEDWFQVENLRLLFPLQTWDNQELRVERNTHKLLDLLDSIKLSSYNPTTPRATFFVLGWIAQRLPALVREIQARGHEVASHGFNHSMCNQLGEAELVEDLTKSKIMLEQLCGCEIKGYRAPNFSINDRILEAVRNCGYRYDSSFNDFSRHGRYGAISTNGYRKHGIAHRINDNFYELPISNLNLNGHTIPWGGGGYFRFFPLWLFTKGIHRILSQTDAYMYYMHPWEIDPGQPRAVQAGKISAWKHYLNLDKTFQRLKNMISTFRYCSFSTCSDYLSATR